MRSLSRSRGVAPPPLVRFAPPNPGGHGSSPHPLPPRPAGDLQRVGRPRRHHRWHHKRNPHPKGGGGGHRGAASRQPRKGGGEGRGALALGEPPSHGRGQATGASQVATALHPQQAQVGLQGRGGQHGKQGASPRTSPPSRSTRPLCFGLHQGGHRDVAKGRGAGGSVGAPERIGDPG